MQDLINWVVYVNEETGAVDLVRTGVALVILVIGVCAIMSAFYVIKGSTRL